MDFIEMSSQLCHNLIKETFNKGGVKMEEVFQNWLIKNNLDKNIEPLVYDDRKIYSIIYKDFLGELVVWHNLIVEEIITNQKTRQQMYYLHYEISDKTETNELVENFKWRIFNINRQDFIIKKDDQLRKILLCCSSGLTSSLFVMKLNDFCKEHNINYHFKAASIFDKEALNKEYDLLLMAPQVQHYTKGLANIFHQRILNIDPNDYGQYNCNNIIAKIQEIFL